MITKPMKAPTKPIPDMSALRFPMLVTPKIDGIRCLVVNGELVSSTFKPIPNTYINEQLRGAVEEGMDGELVVANNFNATTSGVMRKTGEPDFTYCVFDWVKDGDLDETYSNRMGRLYDWKEGSRVIKLIPSFVSTLENLKAFADKCLQHGYEGAMMRDPTGRYKCGRATHKEQLLLKWKPFEDAEARIVGFEEQMQNNNVAEKDAFGRSKRSSHKGNKTGKGTLGKFVVRGVFKGEEIEFRIGAGEGLGKVLRQTIWDNQEKHLDLHIKYKYQLIGSVDAPRIPIFLGFRDEKDMTSW